MNTLRILFRALAQNKQGLVSGYEITRITSGISKFNLLPNENYKEEDREERLLIELTHLYDNDKIFISIDREYNKNLKYFVVFTKDVDSLRGFDIPQEEIIPTIQERIKEQLDYYDEQVKTKEYKLEQLFHKQLEG